MSQQLGTVEGDLQWRDAILAGDVAAWHRFVQRYSDLAVLTAIRWCDPGCRQPGGCTLRRGGGPPLARFLQGECRCDRVGTAYCFLLEKLREKLVFYRGERGCRLDTWIRHLLLPPGREAVPSAGAEYGYRQLYADYLRRVEGRVRAPQEVQRRGAQAEQVYLLHHYGRDATSICESTGLSGEQMAETVEQIEGALAARGPEYYWRFWAHLRVPREVDSLSIEEEDGHESVADPPAPRPGSHVEWEARLIQRAIARSLERLPPIIRHILWLSFDEGLSAAAIAAELQAQGLARWSPRQVYAEIDRALERVCRQVTDALAPVGEAALSPKQMKGILDYWSVGRFLTRREVCAE